MISLAVNNKQMPAYLVTTFADWWGWLDYSKVHKVYSMNGSEKGLDLGSRSIVHAQDLIGI